MITHEEFIEALRTVASQEFADIPETPPEHVFSKKFERKMERIINSMNKYGRPPMRILHKAALITAACLIIFITSATQIKAIREPFIEFILTIYETFIDVDFSGNGPLFITYEYQLTYIPTDFTLTDKRISTNDIYCQYSHNNGDMIRFNQKLIKNPQLSIDTELGNISTICISNMEILFYKSTQFIEAHWSQDGYYMKLTCIGDFDEASLIKMIESVKAVDNTADDDSISE